MSFSSLFKSLSIKGLSRYEIREISMIFHAMEEIYFGRRKKSQP